MKIARHAATVLSLFAITLPDMALAYAAQNVPLDHPNVFISPSGQPFRAKDGEPYPVVDWFKQADKNNDGKIDKAEFVADADAFFVLLDRNHDGVLSPNEIAYYEQRIAPEILGGRVSLGQITGAYLRSPLLQTIGLTLAQSDDGGGGGDEKEHGLAASAQGASPFSFFDEPEPVMAADTSFRGLVNRPAFKATAAAHFTSLDTDDKGFLTLEGLPKTPVQVVVERINSKKRRR